MQTSVTIPATIICFLPEDLIAARMSGLSQALGLCQTGKDLRMMDGVIYLTSPWRRMKGALGYISIISLGSGPLGPVSAEVDRMTGKLNNLPSSA